jgi:3-hydroxyacyl-[acyl-carrier-protein] dehydratase
MSKIPHRYPMLLVDRIVDYVEGESAIGLKNVTINEQIFEGHFPNAPVFPGVLIVEAMAQTAGILVVHSMGQTGSGKLVYFMTIDNAKFRKPVVPGDTMYIHVQCLKSRGNVWKFRGEAKVDGVLCAEAEYSAMIMDAPEKK